MQTAAIEPVTSMGDPMPERITWYLNRFGEDITSPEQPIRDNVSRLVNEYCGEELSHVIGLHYEGQEHIGILIEYEPDNTPPNPIVFYTWYMRTKAQQPKACKVFAYGGVDSPIPTFCNRWTVGVFVPANRCLHLRSKHIARSLMETF